MIATSSPYVGVLAAVSPILATAIGVYLAAKLKQVHTLVNSQMTNALARILELERKLGLAPGESIPGAAVVTTLTEPPDDLLSLTEKP